MASSPKTGTPASDQGPTTDQPAPPSDVPNGPTDPGSTDPGSSIEQPGDALPLQGMPCPQGKCAQGLACTTYYGIAGPRGPAFTSCEISCAQDGNACPDGQSCVTIADGPGRVCRPQE